jgi:hypothetical protein
MSEDQGGYQQSQPQQSTQGQQPTQPQQPAQAQQAAQPQQTAQNQQPAQPQQPAQAQQPTSYVPYNQAPQNPNPAQQPGETSSLVLGILSIVFAGVIGLILGIVDLVKIGKRPKPYSGKVNAGRICSIIGIVLSVIVLIGLASAGTTTSTSSSSTSYSSSAITATTSSESQSASSSSAESDASSVASSDDTASSSSTASSDDSSSQATTTESSVPTEYKNALSKGRSYATVMHMSKQAVYDQLTSEYGEGFTPEAAQYAIDNLTDIDWKENALVKAKEYQTEMNMSKNNIYDQLTSEYGEKFTAEEAQYAIDNLE